MQKILLSMMVAYASMRCDSKPNPKIEQPWPMHHIDRQFYNHNSLSPGDVNQDGYADYCVIHEGPDLYTILFHPGRRGDVRRPWKKVVVGGGGNVEYAYLGDLDGDGNLDVAGVEGLKKGRQAGVRILWGPDKDRADQPEAWKDAGLIPSTIDQGHYLYSECHDINGDDALDIVAGGRVLSSNQSIAGLRWIEAPQDPKDRRDLSKWKMHFIDPDLLSGHGFEYADIDQDGDRDFILCNADWDTPDHKDEALWYENPGNEIPAQRKPWKRHSIHRNLEYFSKAQVAVGDINNDGLVDAATQTDNRVILHIKKSNTPVSWDHIVIQKPALTRWVSRPIELADLNGDGKLDIVGMLIHNFGNTPKDKATVFWMSHYGEVLSSQNWKTHVIKWSDGAYSGKRYQGEKWDHCRFVDVDVDGDLDIVGNCEEHYRFRHGDRITQLGVVWFENPRKQ